MRVIRRTLLAAASACSILVPGAALAQVPPHAPGTICFTQQFWCWANPPGQVRTQCYCASPFGWVPGLRG